MKNTVITREQFLAMLTKRRAGRPLREFAEELKCPFQYLGGVFRGTLAPGPTISKAMGFEQVFAYRRLTPKASRKRGSARPNRKQMRLEDDKRINAIEV